ncbi:MAG: hypothetical protein JRI25_25005, partial [Deltaproteobacteria bacterium]|nr:hypothetical protein [Deltaproteobacteria bacterium]
DSDSDTDTDTSCLDNDPTVEVGTGELGFQSLSELDPVILVFGPQGGYHILGAAWVCNMPIPALVRFKIVHEESETLISDVLYRVRDPNEPPCCGFQTNLFGYIDARNMPGGDTESIPDLLAGEVVVMTMAVDDETYTCTDSRRVTVEWP